MSVFLLVSFYSLQILGDLYLTLGQKRAKGYPLLIPPFAEEQNAAARSEPNSMRSTRLMGGLPYSVPAADCRAPHVLSSCISLYDNLLRKSRKMSQKVLFDEEQCL